MPVFPVIYTRAVDSSQSVFPLTSQLYIILSDGCILEVCMCARESPRRKYIHRQRLDNVISLLVFHALFIQPHKRNLFLVSGLTIKSRLCWNSLCRPESLIANQSFCLTFRNTTCIGRVCCHIWLLTRIFSGIF